MCWIDNVGVGSQIMRLDLAQGYMSRWHVPLSHCHVTPNGDLHVMYIAELYTFYCDFFVKDYSHILQSNGANLYWHVYQIFILRVKIGVADSNGHVTDIKIIHTVSIISETDTDRSFKFCTALQIDKFTYT